MTEPELKEYLENKQAFEKALFQCRLMLDEDARAHVEHYLGHGEMEMAYESLCLSLMEKKAILPKEIKNTLLALGVYWKLDKESVYDFYFWEKAQPYLTE